MDHGPLDAVPLNTGSTVRNYLSLSINYGKRADRSKDKSKNWCHSPRVHASLIFAMSTERTFFFFNDLAHREQRSSVRARQ